MSGARSRPAAQSPKPHAAPKSEPKPKPERRRGKRKTGDAMAMFIAPACLDMRAARALKASLDPLFAARRPCAIDVSQITAASTGCLQILLSFARAMRRESIAVNFVGASPVLSEALARLGIVISNAAPAGES